MSDKPLFADIHCHPNFKPYGQNFDPENVVADPQPEDKTSLWHEVKPNGIDKTLSEEFNVAMYSQSHLKAAAEGGLQIIGLSLAALEKEFITVSGWPETVIDIVGKLAHGAVNLENVFCNLVTRFGVKRLNAVRSSNIYFEDLEKELKFIRAQEHKTFQLDHDHMYYTFRIAHSGAMVANILAQNAAPGAGSTQDQPITLCIVLTMEGLHNLDAGNDAGEALVMEHVEALKNNDFPLFFVTFCHHFWNGLCGHAPSLTGLMAKVFNQKAHMGEGFHPLGLKVLMALLDNTKRRRIHIDIKHMSYKARNQYFRLLEGQMPDDPLIGAELKEELRAFFKFNTKAAPGAVNAMPPVIVSHAAVNGYIDHNHEAKSYQGNFPYPHTPGVENPFENKKVYLDPSINLYDADLKNLGKFKCLIGIQLDVRRIAGTRGFEVAAMEDEKKKDGDEKNGHAYLVWNQVIHMVELWDQYDFPDAWDRICIGSDFDGIVCPMEGLTRVSDYPTLHKGLLYYCRLYFMPAAEFAIAMPGMGERGVIANRFQFSARNPAGKRLNPNGKNAPEHTGLSPQDIVDKICAGNALAFMKTYFV